MECIFCRIQGDCNTQQCEIYPICSSCIEKKFDENITISATIRKGLFQECMKIVTDSPTQCGCCMRDRGLVLDLALCSNHSINKTNNDTLFNVVVEDRDFGEMEFGIFNNSRLMMQALIKLTEYRVSDKLYKITYAVEYEDSSKNTGLSPEFPIAHIEALNCSNNSTCIILVYYQEKMGQGTSEGWSLPKKYNFIRIKKVMLNKPFGSV